MKKLTLNIDALAVESFETAEPAPQFRGTVKGRQKSTIYCTVEGWWCAESGQNTCATCDPCACGQNTCDQNTCAETCEATCPVSCVNTACVSACGGGGGNLSEAHTCAGCDDGGMPHYTAVSPCNNTA
jgi:hypothetical protein